MKRAGVEGEGDAQEAKRNRSSGGGDEEDMMEDAPEIRPEDEQDDWDDDTEAYLAAMSDSVSATHRPVSLGIRSNTPRISTCWPC